MTRIHKLVALSLVLLLGVPSVAMATGDPGRGPGAGLGSSTEDGNATSALPGLGLCEGLPHAGVTLPRDDAPHPAVLFEWWWWYGQVTTPDDHDLAFILLAQSRPSLPFHAMEYSVTDLTAGTFHSAKEPLVVGAPKGGSNGELKLSGRSATVNGLGERHHVKIAVDGYELDLDLEPTKPSVLRLGDGYASAYCQTQYLYAKPRMAVTGTLTRGGTSDPVSGSGTLEHHWGATLANDVASWDWLTLQLDDGRDVGLGIAEVGRGTNLVAVRDGYISHADGTVTRLRADEFELTPTRFWQRDDRCGYPVEMDVRMRDERFHVAARLDHTEMSPARAPLGYVLWPGFSTYWDGPISISGDVAGQGFMDLSQYCR